MIVPSYTARMSWTQIQTSFSLSSQSQPLISTRGNFDNNTAELLPGHTSTYYNATNIPGLRTGACPPELIIFAHGAHVASENASEEFNTAGMSIEKNNYTYHLGALSWFHK